MSPANSQLALLGGEPVRIRPFPSWPQYRPQDLERLVRAFESRHWGGYPVPNILGGEFAARFAEWHDARYGLCVANGTVALIVALQSAGIRFGDEVIVPAYTWDGTAAAVLAVGGVPIFADVDPDTYCLDVASARAAVTPRTKAVLPVHLAMRFVNMDELLALAAERGLTVIEDCAHVHGGSYNGRGAGSMGAVGCFSFQESKLMTSGEGGIVITSDLQHYEALQSLVNCGRASLTDVHKRRVIGFNYRMTELQAAILLGQLEAAPEFAARRSRNAAMLTHELAGIPGLRPLPPQPQITREAIYNYVFRYTPVLEGVPRDLFVTALEAEGIPCEGRFYDAVHRSGLFQPTLEDWPQLAAGRDVPVDYSLVRCPVAERAAYEESVWMPQFLLIGDENDVADIVTAVRKVMTNLPALSEADASLAAVKGMSRTLRPRLERSKNY